MSDIDLTGQNTLYLNQSLCPFYRMLWSKNKTYPKGKIDAPFTGCYGPKIKHILKVRLKAFMCLIGTIKTRIQENARPVTISHTNNFIKYFLGVDLSVVMQNIV